jgi:hypothetical protein
MNYAGTVTMTAQEFAEMVEKIRVLEQNCTLTRYALEETRKKLSELSEKEGTD